MALISVHDGETYKRTQISFEVFVSFLLETVSAPHAINDSLVPLIAANCTI